MYGLNFAIVASVPTAGAKQQVKNNPKRHFWVERFEPPAPEFSDPINILVNPEVGWIPLGKYYCVLCGIRPKGRFTKLYAISYTEPSEGCSLDAFAVISGIVKGYRKTESQKNCIAVIEQPTGEVWVRMRNDNVGHEGDFMIAQCCICSDIEDNGITFFAFTPAFMNASSALTQIDKLKEKTAGRLSKVNAVLSV